MEIDLTRLKMPAEPDELDIREDIRSDLEDSLKEYSETDLLVELLQNALDALDERYYRSICAELEVDPTEPSTIDGWNRTVDELIRQDYDSFPERSTGVSPQAVWQASASQDEIRRRRWASVLLTNLGLEQDSIDKIIELKLDWAKLDIILDLTGPNQLTIVDSGVGIPDPLKAFRHKGSTKRRQDQSRRRGIRGSHGWGLSAILGLCDRVEVATKTDQGEVQALRLERFASFRADATITPVISAFTGDEASSIGLPEVPAVSGTAVRVLLPKPHSGGLLDRLITDGAVEQWANSLRLYTPVGQVNDYVMHPAYHCLRKGDLSVRLTVRRGEDQNSINVPFDYLRLRDLRPEICQDLKDFVDLGMHPGKSVYCVGREKSSSNIYLVAAEIQASKPTMLSIETSSTKLLVSHSTESGDEAPVIPRGIFLALSGGMRSESVALPPLSTNAAYRGVVLAETARATLGRRHTLDQRTSIPNAAKAFARTYDFVRKKTIPSGQAVLTGPALHRWQRKLWRAVIAELLEDPPVSDTKVWAGVNSGEARVMLSFAELLALKVFGDVRVLRCSLQDVYDFQFVYRWSTHSHEGPSSSLSDTLFNQGFVDRSDSGDYRRLGVGEFKSQGDSVLHEFDPTEGDWRKNPNSIDWLICWDFDESVLGEGWTSTQIDEMASHREFQGQTHVWTPAPGNARTRPLPVTSLKRLLLQLTEVGTLNPVEDWGSYVGNNYYDD